MRKQKLEVTLQGSYRSWKTWKVMEFMISSSRPGKSWNFSEGHGKSWKSNMLSENKKKQKDENFEKITDELKTCFNFSGNKNKHVFHAL